MTSPDNEILILEPDDLVIALEPDDFVVVIDDQELDPIDLSLLGSRDYAQIEADVIELTNKERQAHGLLPLTRNEQLTQSALGHTLDMAENHFISHTSSDGSNLAQRVTRTGYKYLIVGENCAMGQRTPQEVVRGWMNSPGHRKNILNDKFAEIGVAYIEGDIIAPNGRVWRGGYWTQNFGTRLSMNQLKPMVTQWWQNTVSSLSGTDDIEKDIVIMNQ